MAGQHPQTELATRRHAHQQGVKLDRGVAGILLAKIRAAFPEDVANFAAWTGASVMEYLIAEGPEFQTRHAERLVALALEYQPLTGVLGMLSTEFLLAVAWKSASSRIRLPLKAPVLTSTMMSPRVP